jgi:hypothetical protein
MIFSGLEEIEKLILISFILTNILKNKFEHNTEVITGNYCTPMMSYHIIYNVMGGRVHVPKLLSVMSNHRPRYKWEDNIKMDL